VVDRRVGGDDAVCAGGHGRSGHVLEAILVGRELHQHGDSFGKRVARAHHLTDQRAQLLLQLAQAGRVGARDVDHRPVGVRRQRAKGRDVVLGGFFVGRVLVAADVDEDPPRLGRQPAQPLGALLGSVIVEAHPVDDGALLDEPEKAWPRVPRLRPRGDGADLDEAETHAEPGGGERLALVHAGGEADGVGKVESPQFLRERTSLEPRPRGETRPQAQDRPGECVSGLCGEQKEQRTQEPIHVRGAH